MTDGRERQPRDPSDGNLAASSSRPDFTGRKQTAAALIELRTDGVPPFANRFDVDHANRHTAATRARESRQPESQRHTARTRRPIQLFWWASIVADCAHPARTAALTGTLDGSVVWLGWIEDDELLEVTPVELRLRKKILAQSFRKR